jgi:pyridoxine 4-dehydrogenase
MLSVFALGRMQVRRSGYGAMQLAGQFAAGTPPDRDSAITVLTASRESPGSGDARSPVTPTG